MEKQPCVFILPSFGILIVTGLWLIAGQLFFVDQWLGRHARNYEEAVIEARMIDAVVNTSSAVQDGMSRWAVLWPQDMRFSFQTAIRSGFHQFLHPGIVVGGVALVLLLVLGLCAESRNGSTHLFGIFFLAWLIELVAVGWSQQPQPVFGAWAWMGAIAASLLCAGNGNFNSTASFFSRCLGLLILFGLLSQWPAYWLSCPISVHQWLPSAGFAGVWSFTTWWWNQDEI